MRSMHPKLRKSFNQYSAQKQHLFERLSDYTDKQLMSQPDEASWSVIQVLDHLYTVERASVNYCLKKIKAGDQIPRSNWWGKLRFQLYMPFLYSKIKFKAPKGVDKPRNEMGIEAMKQIYAQLQDDLERFLEEYPDRFLNRAIYKHPFAGRITLDQMIIFLSAHWGHHQHQLDRLLAVHSGLGDVGQES